MSTFLKFVSVYITITVQVFGVIAPFIHQWALVGYRCGCISCFHFHVSLILLN
jgi:hypothetical protein